MVSRRRSLFDLRRKLQSDVPNGIVASIFNKIVLFKYNTVRFEQRFSLNNCIVVKHLNNEKDTKHKIVETTLSRAVTI